MNLKGWKKNKKGIISEYLPWIIIAILVLAVLFVAIFILREDGTSLIDSLKGLFRRG